jgi:hypothetical protein
MNVCRLVVAGTLRVPFVWGMSEFNSTAHGVCLLQPGASGHII